MRKFKSVQIKKFARGSYAIYVNGRIYAHSRTKTGAKNYANRIRR